MSVRGQIRSWPNWQRHQKDRQNSWKKAETETVLLKHWMDATTTDQNVLERTPQRKKPKMAPWTPCAAARRAGSLAGWGGAWGIPPGEEEQANQGVLKPKGFSMSPAEQCHMQAARFIPEVWPSSSVTHHLGKANNTADNTEIATCLNSWQTVGKVTLFCTLPRDKGLAI